MQDFVEFRLEIVHPLGRRPFLRHHDAANKPAVADGKKRLRDDLEEHDGADHAHDPSERGKPFVTQEEMERVAVASDDRLQQAVNMRFHPRLLAALVAG